MFIDPRVAHGRTQYDLASTRHMFSDNRVPELHEVIRVALKGLGTSPGRRDVLRRLEQRAVPQLGRMGAQASIVRSEDFTGMMVFFVTSDPEGGICEKCIKIDSSLGDTFGIATLVEIEPHALARCMQRNGVSTLKEVHDEIRVALQFAAGIGHLVRREGGWCQVGVPANNGLFVGAVEAGSKLVLKTYLKPDANGRRSRWSAYLAMFQGRPSLSGDPARLDMTAKGWIWDHVEALMREGSVRERFPFLSTPYERAGDPQDERWEAARSAADRESLVA
jgi:hypothetical protein